MVKPYGIGMKAQLKKKTYLIGAQWLRTGREEDGGVDGGGGGSKNSDDGGGVMVNPKIMDIDRIESRGYHNLMISGSNKGVDGREKGVVIAQDSGRRQISVAVGDEEVCNEEDSLLIYDSKRRRMGAEGIGVPTSTMDELLKKTNNLQVTDEDEWEIDKSLSITIAKFNLRGRLCTNTEHSRGFLKKVLGGIWRLKETEWNIKIKDKFDTGLFLTFTFASESIQNKILTKMPWYLSNGLLILGKMENSNESWANDLTNFPIWGKAMGVPTDLLTKNNTTRMANKAGAVIQVQNSDVSRMVADGFFRFQVWMSIMKPVCPGFPLPYSGKKIWIAFKYDELPFMCFKCGRIGHSVKDCNKEPIKIHIEESEEVEAYGVWLKTENGCRDGFQGKRTSMGQVNSQGSLMEKHVTEGATGTINSNMFAPLANTMTGESGKMLQEANTHKEPQQQLDQGGLSANSNYLEGESKSLKQRDMEELYEDGGKGKRRLVETMEEIGYGKLKKTSHSMYNELPNQGLYDIPVTYTTEAQFLSETTSFAAGSTSNVVAKENRRKVSVKKDPKARKGKIVNKVAKNYGVWGCSSTLESS
ncbi:hypothetical protein F8388_011124 [Cannabis sativa]|uniref:CCHC-type domain-containing protein n=1 Tax=Cannabis sativa TaxID=3483 RepID=A0A7J6E6I2_CANSA|nr:hypothetical protein F8388_011124 [Cannabis sativa]KAF4369488.1 hypothetical protein G4B88_016428 [Cannabis sativa]